MALNLAIDSWTMGYFSTGTIQQHSLLSNVEKMIAYLNKRGLAFYHFTDAKNLDSIKEDGLLSLRTLREKKMEFVAGGSPLLRSLSSRFASRGRTRIEGHSKVTKWRKWKDPRFDLARVTLTPATCRPVTANIVNFRAANRAQLRGYPERPGRRRLPPAKSKGE